MLDWLDPLPRELDTRSPFSPGTALWIEGTGWVRITGSGHAHDGTTWVSGRIQPGQPHAHSPVLVTDATGEEPMSSTPDDRETALAHEFWNRFRIRVQTIEDTEPFVVQGQLPDLRPFDFRSRAGLASLSVTGYAREPYSTPTHVCSTPCLDPLNLDQADELLRVVGLLLARLTRELQ
ncbi:hypothetical protein IL38_24040 [Actinopolyspora erythraea]|uniref:Uncharacterized protein n=1 Tax=Actinopolyspora erythraea TaxID=414996 RepID=A0ABR4WYB7_9ACTN|nr:hypothetical protein [Actinopolyspora erythraea]KGI79372.1 hypothetical protein IL38_24040 [Actinopolyspora erythraea]